MVGVPDICPFVVPNTNPVAVCMLGVIAQVTAPNPVAVDIIVAGLNAVIAEFTLKR